MADSDKDRAVKAAAFALHAATTLRQHRKDIGTLANAALKAGGTFKEIVAEKKLLDAAVNEDVPE